MGKPRHRTVRQLAQSDRTRKCSRTQGWKQVGSLQSALDEPTAGRRDARRWGPGTLDRSHGDGSAVYLIPSHLVPWCPQKLVTSPLWAWSGACSAVFTPGSPGWGYGRSRGLRRISGFLALLSISSQPDFFILKN